MSSSNCCLLTWIQVSPEAGQVVWYPISWTIFQFVMIHTVRGFSTVNKAKVDVFLELSCFFDDPAYVGNLICGSSAFSKTGLNIRKFTVHVLLKPDLENFEHYFTSMWDGSSKVKVITFQRTNSYTFIWLPISVVAFKHVNKLTLLNILLRIFASISSGDIKL